MSAIENTDFPEIPAGYRLLHAGEITQLGDRTWSKANAAWVEVSFAGLHSDGRRIIRPNRLWSIDNRQPPNLFLSFAEEIPPVKTFAEITGLRLKLAHLIGITDEERAALSMAIEDKEMDITAFYLGRKVSLCEKPSPLEEITR